MSNGIILYKTLKDEMSMVKKLVITFAIVAFKFGI
jgi:hypothetical protein